MLSASKKITNVLLVLVLVSGLALTACDSSQPAATPTAEALISEPSQPESSEAGILTVETKTLVEQQENYNIEIDIPVFSSDNLPTGEINAELEQMAANLMDQFKSDVAYLPEEMAASGTTSYVDMNYGISLNDHNLVSIVFNVEQYMAGAAHPNQLAAAVNYDFDQNRALDLTELFTADTDVYALMSELATQSLVEQGLPLQPESLPADPAYYQAWALTPDGLLISFSAGDVTATAAGMVEAPLAYDLFKAYLDPAGPLDFLFE